MVPLRCYHTEGRLNLRYYTTIPDHLEMTTRSVPSSISKWSETPGDTSPFLSDLPPAETTRDDHTTNHTRTINLHFSHSHTRFLLVKGGFHSLNTLEDKIQLDSRAWSQDQDQGQDQDQMSAL